MAYFWRLRHLSYREGAVLRLLIVQEEESLMLFGTTRFSVVALCLSLSVFSGCVTQTERISPYQRTPKDESVWEELRREFGRRDSQTMRESSSEPFYKRTMRGVKESISGLFREDSVGLSEQEIAADRRRFERKRAQALEQLRDQQKEAQGEEE